MRRLLTSGIFVVFCFLTVVILAQVPQLLNYQGRLTDDKGIPIITPTTVRFSLYQGGDAATPGSGTLVYQEDASVTPDDNGVFSHLIGSGTVIYGALDATVFQTADPVYLEITIDPAGANETLLPRKQIVTVGYSFKAELADDADTVDGQDAAAFAPVVHNHDPDYVNEGQADSVTTSMIVNGTIVDADINAGANIAGSKIDTTGLDADLLDGKDSLEFVHTAGDDMTGTLNVNTSTTPALYGKTSHTSGMGVYGEATATVGINSGLYGKSNSPDGRGVWGIAPNCGVYGMATAGTGTIYGVFGKGSGYSGLGVYGQAPTYGVYGYAVENTGTTYGVYGKTNSPSGYAGYFEGNAHVTGDLTVGGGLDADLLDGKDSLEFVHTAGDDMTGTLNVNTSTTPALYGTTSATSGMAVAGLASATSGVNYGVSGQSKSTSGIGVYGFASATSGTNYGVYGASYSSSGYAGYFEGNAHVTGDFTVGGGLDADLLDGKDSLEFVHTAGDDMTGTLTINTSAAQSLLGTTSSTSGKGVYGLASATSGTNYGVYGTTASSSAWASGVYGEATATSGVNYGLYGKSASSSGYGLRAEAPYYGIRGEATDGSGVTYAVYGYNLSTSGRGVYGYAINTIGVNYGVYGRSESIGGYGVYGEAAATSGVTCGLYGESNSSGGYGVYGKSANNGVYGEAASGVGVFGFASAFSGLNYGVYGTTNSSSGYAGYFSGNAHVTGNFTVGGSKTCVQPIDNGKKVLLYAMESPEIWFEDFGSAQLVNGQAVVQLESVFTQAANTEIAYFVFPIPNGDCNGLYIARQDKDSFEVRELGGGTSSISFHYRIVAKRRGYEEVRFEEFTEPEQSPAEPNLPVEKK